MELQWEEDSMDPAGWECKAQGQGPKQQLAVGNAP
jgi:hypothetical protein